MKQPEPRPVTEHLDWSRPELAEAGEAVEELLEGDGWKAVQRAIEARLRFEQAQMMRTPPHGEEHRYERAIGQWAGLRQVRAIAEGIVRAGKEAEREMREAA